MTQGADVLVVKGCPVCNGIHVYSLHIQSSPYLAFNNRSRRLFPLRRHFTCPAIGEVFLVDTHIVEPDGIEYEKVAPKQLIAAEALIETDIGQKLTDEEQKLISFLHSPSNVSVPFELPTSGLRFKGFNIRGIVTSGR